MNALRAHLFLLLAAWLLCGPAALGQYGRDRSVELSALVRTAPPRILLVWRKPVATPLAQKLYRRLKDGPAWTELVTLPPTALTYADAGVSVGQAYEYFLFQIFDGDPGTATGYLDAGIRVPTTAEPGRVILLVEATQAIPLAAELAQFTTDLIGDGWTVTRRDVARTAAVTSVRSTIQTLYNADPLHPTALILFGHLPVPYSGDLASDGHPEHYGAWPADVYYGDVNGAWTDSIINDSAASDPRQHNVPGDGKFDQSVLPSDVELQVGRIDLSNLPAFGLSETELLRQYLRRDHDFRFRRGAYASTLRRGLVDDDFGFYAGEAFAADGWRNFTALFGQGRVKSAVWFDVLQKQKYLCAYGCGNGSYVSANGVGATADFASKKSLAVLNLLFGSFFGDWDSPDNFLRAPLAGTPSSLGLASVWAGRPHWVFQHLALGESLGAATRRTQNNRGPWPAGYDTNNTERAVHLALMGDPTLRLFPVKPPSGLIVRAGASAVTLSWTPSRDVPIEGYLVSRATSPDGPFVRLRGGPVAGRTLVDRTAQPGATYTYLVRAVKRETTGSGTFSNPSQGAFSAEVTVKDATGPEINLTGNGNPVVAGDPVPNALNGTDFGAVELGQSVTRTFTMANPGPTALEISNVTLAGLESAGFSIVGNVPTSVAGGGTATLKITFQPTAIGARAATLTLASNDANERSTVVALGGSGIAAHAEMAVSPTSITRTLAAGASASIPIAINNPGPGALTYTAISSLTRYSARDSSSFGGPTYAWVNISSTGTPVPGWSTVDDGLTQLLPLGFDFPFYGQTFPSVRICSNGYLTFSNGIRYGANSTLPNLSAPASLIALFWSDLVVSGNGQVFTQQRNGTFVVQFDRVSLLDDSTQQITGQAILRPNGEIIFQYKALTQSGNHYTLGIQNELCNDALLIAANVDYVQPNLAVRIRPPGLESWLNLGSSPGTIAAGGSLQIPVTLNTNGLAVGDYFAEITVQSNASSNATVVIPVRLTVTN